MRQVSSVILFTCVVVFIGGVRGASAQIGAESNVDKREIQGKPVQSERDEQEGLFNYYFQDRNLKYETRLAELKTTASVPNWRIPYSASIYPQSAGGMGNAGVRSGLFGRRQWGGSSALSVYDRAFHDGQDQANAYEVQRLMGSGRGLFPGRQMRRNSEPWEGYCSGFTASTIRHPEPVRPVDAGDFGGTPGVVFQPADIKALLSSIYNRTTDDSYLYLAPPSARDGGPNMGTFHLTLANYIGRAGHPIGIDRTKGRAPWNNPVYAYEVTSITDAGEAGHVHYKRVETTITYSFYGSDSYQQTDAQSGEVRENQKQAMALRYTLGLDDDGRIIGGTAITDSGYFLWIPLHAVQGTEDGKAPGNPYLDVQKVVALARASALPEAQKKFDESNIGPPADSSLVKKPHDTKSQPGA